jgi:tripartite-type tricarboxylate transporter receptor subunit TctC
MGQFLNQTLVIENKAGAGGGIGMAQVARAEPNGYQVLFALSSFVVIPEADKVLNRAPMYQLNQLKAIARFAADPTVLVVKADSPYKTYADFIAYVKANPAKVSFGSSGNYGSMHIPIEQLKVATSTNMLHVPYTGAGPAVAALLGGQIEVLSTGPASVVQQIQGGKLRALAHWGPDKLAALPAVPSLTSLGVPIVYAQWAGLFVPAEVPEPIVQKLRDAARFAANDAATQQALIAAGTVMQYQDANEFAAYVAADAAEMKTLVQKIGKLE